MIYGSVRTASKSAGRAISADKKPLRRGPRTSSRHNSADGDAFPVSWTAERLEEEPVPGCLPATPPNHRALLLHATVEFAKTLSFSGLRKTDNWHQMESSHKLGFL